MRMANWIAHIANGLWYFFKWRSYLDPAGQASEPKEIDETKEEWEEYMIEDDEHYASKLYPYSKDSYEEYVLRTYEEDLQLGSNKDGHQEDCD
ncbi:hypothetical protein H6G33_10075 [Calothrix sp. FACHB-1219]|uniref:hypothetical protein n=1 Tax=unclassified Calothrix TaxID=2619626 RepID=UPI0019C592E4|nr:MULTISPECIES: hypothetical protein [unclassified Calothrix]MBD2201694.1 hypothetical protein [Calothrix sp. FACHB-168]MBD2217380.1 hypothetical protein [Calothrix sp. FACHB-1219]